MQGKRSQTVQGVLSELRKAIVMGLLEDGTCVKEIAFAEKLACSRAALRGALSVLEQEGLIKVNPNGTKVISALTDEDINNLYQMRSYVECSAIEQILNKKTDISKLLIVIESSKENKEGNFLDSDTAFHETLVNLSGNKALIQTWNTFEPVIREVFKLNFSRSREIVNCFEERHMAIFRLLLNKDKRAIDALKAHIEEARVISVS